MSRSYSISEAVRKTSELKKMMANQFQDCLPEEKNEETPNESNISTDDRSTAVTEATCNETGFNIITETVKPRVAKPVNRPGRPQRPGPSLRPKSKPVLLRDAGEQADERQATSSQCATREIHQPTTPIERKPQPFTDRYERVTTYLEKPLFRRVHDLHQRGEIAKIAGLLNASVREYLDRHYSL